MKALYGSLHRPIFAFLICAVPLLFTIDDGLDFIYNICTTGWLQPISRIFYGVYLTHFLMFHYEFATTRTSFTFSIYNAFKYFVGDNDLLIRSRIILRTINRASGQKCYKCFTKTHLMIRIPLSNTLKKVD